MSKKPKHRQPGYLAAVTNLYRHPGGNQMNYELLNTSDLFETETKLQQARRVLTEYAVCVTVGNETPEDMAVVLSKTLADVIAYAESLECIAFDDMTVGELESLREQGRSNRANQ